MAPQGFQRIIIPLKFFVCQHRVNLFVARAAEIDEAGSDILTGKIFFVFLIFVPRTRNEMVFGDLPHLTAA